MQCACDHHKQAAESCRHQEVIRNIVTRGCSPGHHSVARGQAQDTVWHQLGVMLEGLKVKSMPIRNAHAARNYNLCLAQDLRQHGGGSHVNNIRKALAPRNRSELFEKPFSQTSAVPVSLPPLGPRYLCAPPWSVLHHSMDHIAIVQRTASRKDSASQAG